MIILYLKMHMVGLVRAFFLAETKITNKAFNGGCLMFSKYLQVPKMIKEIISLWQSFRVM